MATDTNIQPLTLKDLDARMQSNESIVMELGINASNYMEPDKYFLLKSSSKVKEIVSLLMLLEPEIIDSSEIAFFNDDNEMIAEFSTREFMQYYNITQLLTK